MDRVQPHVPSRRGERLDLVWALAAAAVVFAVDLVAPARLHVAVFHVAVVVAASRLRARQILIVGAACTGFSAAALLSPTVGGGGPEVLGRVLVTVAIRSE